MKHAWIYAAAIAVVALSVIVYTHRAPQQSVTTTAPQIIHLSGNPIRVSIASTSAQREQGLSGRTGLGPDEGMLFVFEQDGDYAFWMKDMLFSIDIVWIDSSGKIVYIATSVAPDTYPQAFDPKMNARYVLELPAGYMQTHGIKSGDTVEL